MPVSLTSLKPKIVIAGGSGFLGQLTAQSFAKDGYEVVVLSRNSSFSSQAKGRIVFWNAKTLGPWTNELEGADVLINLTGRSIDCRHTESNRIDILESRIDSTRVLGEAIFSCNKPPKSWLNASSMALYGQCTENEPASNENSPNLTTGFLEEVTVAWEKEFFSFKRAEVRQIALRISFILGRTGGAFPVLRKLCSLGLGGRQGTGTQWMSWLHEDDWTKVVRFLCKNHHIYGPVNLSSPQPIMNKDFMKTMREFFAPYGFGIPAPSWGVFMGCALLGSAPELALQSRRVVSSVLDIQKYEFKYPVLRDAIKSLRS